MKQSSILASVFVLVFAAPRARAQPAPDDGVTAPLPMGDAVAATGRVVDARGKPVRGATVALEGATATAITDRAGRFTITAPLGAMLVIDAPGYETGLAGVTGPALDDLVLLTVGETTEVVQVDGQAPVVAAGAASLDRTELARIPGTGGDLVRSLTIMPGVVNTQAPTGFGGIVIRGSSPEDSKILIDGFEVPLLYHSLGFRAVLPTEAIDTLDYVPGGFDVAYGHAASGIVSLTTRAGAGHRSAQAEVSVIDGGVLAQGALGAKTRYMVAFRRSTIDLVLPYVLPASLDLSLTTVPRYYDEQVRIDHALTPHWDLSLSSIGSDDLLELYSDKAENPDKRFYSRTRFLRATAAARWHDGPWLATLATSGLLQEIDVEIGADQYLKVTPDTWTTRAELSRTTRATAGLNDLTLRLGGEAAVGRAGLELALPQQPREGDPGGTMGGPDGFADDTDTRFTGKVWSPDFAQWGTVTAGLSKDLHVSGGVRVDELQRNRAVAVQPRGELRINATPHTVVRFSAGAYARPPENQEEYLHDDLGFERATQLIAGVEYQPSAPLRLQGSIYYTDRARLITRDAMGTLGNWGTGASYGAELLGTYRAAPWFVWLSGSFSRSTRVDYPGAAERLFDYDQPVSINAAASWKHGKWTLGGRFQLYSGKPSTPVIGATFDSDANTYDPIYGATNSDRAPMHHQLDLRIDRTWQWGAVTLTGFLDVQNVYLNQSVAGYAYSYDYSEKLEFTSLPIIPSIGLRGQL